MRVVLRLPDPTAPGLPRMILVSLAAHLTLVLLAFTLPGLLPSRRRPVFDTILVGRLVELPGGAQAAPSPGPPSPPPEAAPVPRAEPAPPTPPPPPRETKPAPDRPARPPAAQRTPKPTPPDAAPASGPPTTGTPEAAATSPAGDGRPGTAGEGAPSTGAGTDQGIGIAFGSSFGHAYYTAQLVNKLRAAWQRPLLPSAESPALSTRVRFRIDRRGGVSGVEIDVPSAYPLLDDSALRAVYQAAPFPPLPPAYTGDSLDLAITFTLEQAGGAAALPEARA